jgi:hypothetical protein
MNILGVGFLTVPGGPIFPFLQIVDLRKNLLGRGIDHGRSFDMDFGRQEIRYTDHQENQADQTIQNRRPNWTPLVTGNDFCHPHNPLSPAAKALRNSGGLALKLLESKSDFGRLAKLELPGTSIAPIESDVFESRVHFFERLLAKVRDFQQVIASAVQQISHREDPSFFQTICCTNRKPDLGGAQIQSFHQAAIFLFRLDQWNAGHRGPSLSRKVVYQVVLSS